MLKREIFGVFTKGTHIGSTTQGYDSANVIAVTMKDKTIAICYFDLSTTTCVMGQFEDEVGYSAMRTLLSQIRPVEIIIEKDALPTELEKMLKN